MDYAADVELIRYYYFKSTLRPGRGKGRQNKPRNGRQNAAEQQGVSVNCFNLILRSSPTRTPLFLFFLFFIFKGGQVVEGTSARSTYGMFVASVHGGSVSFMVQPMLPPHMR